MREYYELRVNEEFVHLLFSPDEGERIGESVRKVILLGDDPRLREVARLQRQVKAEEGRLFVFSTYIRRQYSGGELKAAELLVLLPSEFEPAGEQCGTVYNESVACPVCGAGANQVGDLILDLRKVPKRWDIATTIADEWVVSQRLAELIVDTAMTGFELRRVRHKAQYQDDPIPFESYPTGRELLRRAEEARAPYPSWAFWVWLNRHEQAEALERMEREHERAMKLREMWRPHRLPVRHQLVVTSKPVAIAPQTRFSKDDPFEEDLGGQYRCPFSHVRGLSVASELFVFRDGWDGCDVIRTKEMVGLRSGVLRPSPLVLISQRLWRLMRDSKMKGLGVQVAHLV